MGLVTIGKAPLFNMDLESGCGSSPDQLFNAAHILDLHLEESERTVLCTGILEITDSRVQCVSEQDSS